MLTYLPPVTQVVLVLIVLTAGIYDLRYRRIPNWLVLVGLVLGFAVNLYWLGLLSGLAQSGKGMGLAITRARLERLYGNRHRFELVNAPEGGLLVTLEIPFQPSNPEQVPTQ